MKVNKINAAPVASNIYENNTNTNSVAFTGKKINCKDIKDAFTKDSGWLPDSLLKLKRQGTMGGNLFLTNAFAFLLGTRIITSRDKDEKREIFIRDIPSIIIAVFGVDSIQKATANLLNKKGFPIMIKKEESGWIMKGLKKLIGKEDNGDYSEVSYNQLKDWFVYDKNNPIGLEKFSKRLCHKDLGGNLKTIYSTLSKDIEKDLANCTTNEEVISKFKAHKNIEEKIVEALSNTKNNALHQAETLKTVPTIVGFAVTLALLGFFIPKLNIHITEKISKKRKAEEEANNNTKVA